MDLSTISTEDLVALQKGDLSRVSTAGLQQMQAMQSASRAPPKSDAYNEGFGGAGTSDRQRATMAMAQGPLFGFADEVMGGVVGGAKSLIKGVPYQQAYEQERDWARGATDRAQKDRPIETFASQMLPAVATGMPIAAGLRAAAAPVAKALGAGNLLTPMLPQVPQTVKNIGTAMTAGTVSGGINALGGSEATTGQALGDDAAKGMQWGAAAPLGLLAITRGGGAVANAVSSRFSDSAAARYAKEKLAQAFLRDSPAGIADPMGRADSRLGKLGPEGAVVDAGGASVRGLLDTLATLPGGTKQATEAMIRSRQAGRGLRMRDAADEALGTNGQRLPETLASLIEQRSQASAPLYQRLYKVDVPVDQELADIVSRAMRLGADKTAQKIATGRNLPWTLSDDAVNGSGTYSMRDLDQLKQGIDDLMGSSAALDKATGGPNRLGSALEVLRKDLLGKLDTTTFGKYAEARKAFSGPSSIIDAANSGRRALTQDDSAITSMLKGLSPAETEGFRIGAYEALRAKLGTAGGQTNIINMWREPATQERLRAIFGNERAFREFASRVSAEGKMKAVEGIGRGSQTASRQFAAGDLDNPALQDIGAAAVSAQTGNLWGVLNAGKQAWNRVATPEPVRDAMGKLLLTRGPQAKAGLLDLRDIADEVRRNRQQQAQAMGLLGGYFGQ